ncbi:MAG: hypothetical protein M3Q30_18325 [Actinomycetota bacterium]|nr:hypothetical protein [Actinomycetota bacterium]
MSDDYGQWLAHARANADAYGIAFPEHSAVILERNADGGIVVRVVSFMSDGTAVPVELWDFTVGFGHPIRSGPIVLTEAQGERLTSTFEAIGDDAPEGGTE